MRFFFHTSRLARTALLLAVIFIAAESAASTHEHLLDLEQQADCDICLLISAGKATAPSIELDFGDRVASFVGIASKESLFQTLLVSLHNRDPPLSI